MKMKVRLGIEKEHAEWDGREELRPTLRLLLKNNLVGETIIGERGEDEFIYNLLWDHEVTEALKMVKMVEPVQISIPYDSSGGVLVDDAQHEEEKLVRKTVKLIQQKRERWNMKNILQEAAEMALGSNEVSERTLYQLLEDDKRILEAAKTIKISRENKNKKAEMLALNNLLVLMAQAR